MNRPNAGHVNHLINLTYIYTFVRNTRNIQ